jgi:hypothetical protein
MSATLSPEQHARRAFVREHRTAVFGYGRRAEGPSMSIVYYVMEGDSEILVSTMRARAKAKAVERGSKVSLCVLDEKWPPSYLEVYCTAHLDPDFVAAADLLFRISEVMAGEPMPESAHVDVENIVRREDRVVLRLTPYASFRTPPRHVKGPSDLKTLTHWTSNSLPW